MAEEHKQADEACCGSGCGAPCGVAVMPLSSEEQERRAARSAGAAAFTDGVPSDDNPYARGQTGINGPRYEWWAGWYGARGDAVLQRIEERRAKELAAKAENEAAATR